MGDRGDHGDRKTQPTRQDVDAFLDAVADDRRRADARDVLDTMRRVTGTEPRMWGGSIVGFGHQPYTTADGKEHDFLAIGFSPRKAALTLYGLTYDGSNDDLLERLRAVAPGGTLPSVHHQLDATRAAEHGFDLSAHVTPSRLATHLDHHWELEVYETRERHGCPAPSTRAPDIVLRARRR